MAAKSEDAAKGDVQQQVDDEQAQGVLGQKVDPIPDAEYTLTTGPDSPGRAEDHVTGTSQVSAQKGEGG